MEVQTFVVLRVLFEPYFFDPYFFLGCPDYGSWLVKTTFGGEFKPCIARDSA